jgi:murein DD-endopeptidase MepM/ murein hydrolase activator NlpD
MASKINSPLLGAFNNIVNINRSKSAMNSTRSSFNNFLNFMEIETTKLKSIKLPEKRKIKALQSINVASTFGRPGSLLSSLFSGALDLGGFLGNMFGRKEKSPKAGKPIPKAKGVKFGGVRALGVLNAVFAGLDIAQGISEGESIGKATAGASGALAGSIVGAAIGSVGGPLGVVLGSMAGNFLGGYLADRGYEVATGGGKSVKEKTKERLKTQEKKQREQAAVSGTTFTDAVNRFDQVVTNFEKFAYTGFANVMNAAAAATGQEENLEWGAEYPDEQQGNPDATGQYEDVMAEGGKLPSSSIKTSGFGWRWGKMHQGNDYAGPGVNFQPVSVIQPGKVAVAGPLGSAGNSVVIDHPDGTTTKYFHLMDNSIKVRVGQQIQPGQVVGNVGSTGRSTGPHLHFEVWRNGRAQDPTADADRYFRFGGNVKVKPKPGGSSNAPTAVIMAGTNDADANTAAANVKKSIEELKAKGYRVVVVPPSQQTGSPYANIGAAIEKVAKDSGAEVRTKTYKGAGDTYPFAHMNKTSVDSLRREFPNAKFIGDSNAEPFKGSMNYTGKPSATILDAVRTLPNVRPGGQGGPEGDAAILESMVRSGSMIPIMPQQVSQYPSYDTGSNNVVLVPIMYGQGQQQRPMVISSGSGGQQMMISPPPSQGSMLNNVVKTLMLTNLSGS